MVLKVILPLGQVCYVQGGIESTEMLPLGQICYVQGGIESTEILPLGQVCYVQGSITTENTENTHERSFSETFLVLRLKHFQYWSYWTVVLSL